MNFLHICNISVTFIGEELSNRSTDNKAEELPTTF